MPGEMDGLAALAAFRKIDRTVPVLVLSGQGRTATVVQAMKLGAIDFVSKPFEEADLEAPLLSALRQRQLCREVAHLREQLQGEARHTLLYGRSERMVRIRELIDRVADTDIPVLICGESGTGKELVARALYAKSRRCDRPFVKVNCTGPSRRRARVGAVRVRTRRLHRRDAAQAGQVRVRQSRHAVPRRARGDDPLASGKAPARAAGWRVLAPGGKVDVHVDVRVIAATNQDLDAAVAAGRFREDLFRRLNEVTIALPPLRERREEIPALTDFFIKKYSVQYNRPLIEITPPTLQALVDHDWPGNVRELENLAKRVVVLGTESTVLKDLQHAAAAAPSSSGRGTPSLQPAPSRRWVHRPARRRPVQPSRLPRMRPRCPLRCRPVAADRAGPVLAEGRLASCRPRGGAGADSPHAAAHPVEPQGSSRDPRDQLQGAALQDQGKRPRQGLVAIMASDSQMQPGPRVLARALFDAVLETELKRAVRGQNFVTLVMMDTRREWDGLMLSADEGTLVGLADVVGREVRDTNPLGHNGKGALALLLIDADYEHSTRVVDRLVAGSTTTSFPRRCTSPSAPRATPRTRWMPARCGDRRWRGRSSTGAAAPRPARSGTESHAYTIARSRHARGLLGRSVCRRPDNARRHSRARSAGRHAAGRHAAGRRAGRHATGGEAPGGHGREQRACGHDGAGDPGAFSRAAGRGGAAARITGSPSATSCASRSTRTHSSPSRSRCVRTARSRCRSSAT